MSTIPPKAAAKDNLGRFREIVSDPLNLLIERAPGAGLVSPDGLVTLHNGVQVPFSGEHAYYEGFSDVLVINRGVHEPLEEFVFQEVLRLMPERPVMMELGAYWGHYSMWLNKVRPHAQNWLVEPNGHNLEIGRRNFERNGMTGEFIRSSVRKGGFEVDRYLAKRRIGRLDILHADIQGFELEMLDGAADTLRARKADYVFVSTHSAELHDGVKAALAGHGYRVEISSDFDNETTSFDGLVFASSPAKPAVFGGFAPLGRLEICASSAELRVEYVSRALLARRAIPAATGSAGALSRLQAAVRGRLGLAL